MRSRVRTKRVGTRSLMAWYVVAHGVGMWLLMAWVRGYSWREQMFLLARQADNTTRCATAQAGINIANSCRAPRAHGRCACSILQADSKGAVRWRLAIPYFLPGIFSKATPPRTFALIWPGYSRRMRRHWTSCSVAPRRY